MLAPEVMEEPVGGGDPDHLGHEVVSLPLLSPSRLHKDVSDLAPVITGHWHIVLPHNIGGLGEPHMLSLTLLTVTHQRAPQGARGARGGAREGELVLPAHMHEDPPPHALEHCEGITDER